MMQKANDSRSATRDIVIGNPVAVGGTSAATELTIAILLTTLSVMARFSAADTQAVGL